jgi:hypothetical protein
MVRHDAMLHAIKLVTAAVEAEAFNAHVTGSDLAKQIATAIEDITDRLIEISNK